jgi:hypothetical protein
LKWFIKKCTEFEVVYKKIVQNLKWFREKFVQKIKKHILCSTIFFSPENPVVYGVKWKNMVELETPKLPMQYGACALHVG